MNPARPTAAQAYSGQATPHRTLADVAGALDAPLTGDGQVQVGEVVLIYSWPSVEERNETHEVDAYLPSHVSIGNDSGDYEFLIRRDGSPTVYQCDAGALGSACPRHRQRMCAS